MNSRFILVNTSLLQSSDRISIIKDSLFNKASPALHPHQGSLNYRDAYLMKKIQLIEKLKHTPFNG